MFNTNTREALKLEQEALGGIELNYSILLVHSRFKSMMIVLYRSRHLGVIKVELVSITSSITTAFKRYKLNDGEIVPRYWISYWAEWSNYFEFQGKAY